MSKQFSVMLRPSSNQDGERDQDGERAQDVGTPHRRLSGR